MSFKNLSPYPICQTFNKLYATASLLFYSATSCESRRVAECLHTNLCLNKIVTGARFVSGRMLNVYTVIDPAWPSRTTFAFYGMSTHLADDSLPLGLFWCVPRPSCQPTTAATLLSKRAKQFQSQICSDAANFAQLLQRDFL